MHKLMFHHLHSDLVFRQGCHFRHHFRPGIKFKEMFISWSNDSQKAPADTQRVFLRTSN
jgi:hypothetical protein